MRPIGFGPWYLQDRLGDHDWTSCTREIKNHHLELRSLKPWSRVGPYKKGAAHNNEIRGRPDVEPKREDGISNTWVILPSDISKVRRWAEGQSMTEREQLIEHLTKVLTYVTWECSYVIGEVGGFRCTRCCWSWYRLNTVACFVNAKLHSG